MTQRHMITPDDARVRSVMASDNPSPRAYRARLRRAERAGILPPRVYLSSQRFAYDAEELEAAVARLPRNYTATLTTSAA